MNKLSKLLVVLFFITAIKSPAQDFFPLWPKDKKPNFNGKIVTDSVSNERIWRVGTPGFYAFPVPKAENKGTAVLICPGGGLERLNSIYDGFQFARWYNAHGINAFVLIYRLPHQADLQERAIAPLQDAQRAMRLIRGHAATWGIKPDKIGVTGNSAGGYVASALGTHVEDVSAIKDSMDGVSFRPNFMLLFWPVITMGPSAHPGSKKNLLGGDTSKAMIEKYSNELHVSASTPPAFIVHTQYDSIVSVKNSLLFYNALVENNVSAALHIFPQGGHGVRLVDSPGSSALWLNLLELWLNEKGFTAPIVRK